MSRNGIRMAAGVIVAAALLLIACGGGDQAPPAGSQVETTEQTQDEEARVQVIRGRATLGDPDAPVVIEEYSDFL